MVGTLWAIWNSGEQSDRNSGYLIYQVVEEISDYVYVRPIWSNEREYMHKRWLTKFA